MIVNQYLWINGRGGGVEANSVTSYWAEIRNLKMSEMILNVYSNGVN